MANIELLNNALISIFCVVITMSIQAAVVAVIVILIKKLFTFKMNIRIGYLLWILVFIRLVFPTLPENPLSILNYADFGISGKISAWKDNALRQQAIQAPSTVDGSSSGNDYGSLPAYVYSTGMVSSGTGGNGTKSQANSSMPDVDVQTDASYDRFQEFAANLLQMEFFKGLPERGMLLAVSYIWVVGTISIVAYMIAKNAVFTLRLRKMPDVTSSLGLSETVEWIKSVTRVNRTVKFVEMEEIGSPCVFGVVNCTVILPKGLLKELVFSNNGSLDGIDDTGNAGCVDNAEANKKAVFHILAHEFAHIKRNDLAAGWLTFLICAVHWFNPMVWYCLRILKREQELCADAYAMSFMDEEEFEQYGQTLLSVLKKGRKRLLSTVMAGIIEDKDALKQRIINIATFEKNKYRLTLMGILVVLIAAVFLCTSRMNYPKTAEQRMEFDDNIMMSFMSNNSNDSKSLELEIINNNDIAVHSCQLQVYDISPYKSENSRLVYQAKNFSIGGRKSVKHHLNDVDYNKAYVRFGYKVGFSFDGRSNMIWRSGDLTALDQTLQVNEWEGVSQQELNAFIDDNDINVTAITRIYDFCTIVMFEEDNSWGYYELYKDSSTGELMSRKVTAFGYNLDGDARPVQMLGGTRSGNFPFINFKINSPVLVALGDKIEIQTDNGTIVRHVSGEAFHTVETRSYGSISKILIYDRNNELLYDGNKLLMEDVSFNLDDPSYAKIMEEKGYKIVNQSLIGHSITFTPGMFPDEYVAAYQSDDIDWKIPLFACENTTMYLKCIVESNESPNYLYAIFYFIHDIGRSPGNILTVGEVNFRDGVPHSYTPTGTVKRDVFSTALKTTIEDAVSGRNIGPGCQMAICLKKSVVEQTKGDFTVELEGLNLISYVPKSQYIPFDEQKKKRIRDMVYNQLVAGSTDKLTGGEEIYATVGHKGQQVFDLYAKKRVDVSGRYVYCVSFHTELDGLLGPITALVDPRTEKIIGVFPRY